MSELKVMRLLSLPSTLEASTLYITKNSEPGYVDLTVTGTDNAVVLKTVSPQDVDSAIETALQNQTVELSNRTNGFSAAGRFRSIDSEFAVPQLSNTNDWKTIAIVRNDVDKVVWARMRLLVVHNSMASWWSVAFSGHIRHRTSEYGDIVNMTAVCTDPAYEQTGPNFVEFRLFEDGPVGAPNYFIQARNNGYGTQVYLDEVTGTGVNALEWAPDEEPGGLTPGPA